MTGAVIEAEGLVKTYGDVKALDGVDLRAQEGSVLALLGPNGAGKTTTIRILSTLLKPDAGTARVLGRDVITEAAKLRSQIGLAGQYAAVDENLTGKENLELFGRLYRLGARNARARADELLTQFELGDAGSRPVSGYSGGMRRRLDLAAALIARPPVLFLDEPTSGLDPRSRLGLWDTIADRVSDGTTVLLTTQYLEEADRLADRIAVVDHGRVIAEGTSADLKDRVGGDRLEVQLANPEQAAIAIAALNPIATEAPVLKDDMLRTAVMRRSGTTVEALRRLDQAGVEVADLTLRRPTLDDVFLTLTGREAEAEAESESEPQPDHRAEAA
jgi:ABC-2 type transport system ATP-binding protein